MKVCNCCNKEKEESDFYKRRVAGKLYPRTVCKVCENKKTHDRRTNTGYYEANREKRREIRRISGKKRRQAPETVHLFIMQDAKRGDRIKGRENDLDAEFVKNAISSGCFYCGEIEGRMSLDRIDNAIGHTKNNVVGCCLRCNLVRGSMPYAAWVVVAQGMKDAREQGLFGDWEGRKRVKK